MQQLYMSEGGKHTSSNRLENTPTQKRCSRSVSSKTSFNLTSTTFTECHSGFRNVDIYVVGSVGHPAAHIVRVVHISDTCGRHDNIAPIPPGHILVHTGNFSDARLTQRIFPQRKRDILQETQAINSFFERQPHEFKVFIPGNQDVYLERHSPACLQAFMPSVVYLQEASCVLFGLKFFGSSWNSIKPTSVAPRAFSHSWSAMRQHWKSEIPHDTDVLLTHIPPWNPGIYEIVSNDIKYYLWSCTSYLQPLQFLTLSHLLLMIFILFNRIGWCSTARNRQPDAKPFLF